MPEDPRLILEPPPAGLGITLLVSGGQTGADRGGLDAAADLGIRRGGWCPLGRRAEDGRIPAEYPMLETDSSDYPDRTRRNIALADATLIFTWGRPERGSALTISTADQLGRPYSWIDLSSCAARDLDFVAGLVRTFLAERDRKPRSLNVAGSRESQYTGPLKLQAIVRRVVRQALTLYRSEAT